MKARILEPRDVDAWTRMRVLLWPEIEASELAAEARKFVASGSIPTADAAFAALDDSETVVGFLELSIRPFSDGCDSMPVPHVEGWYVEEAYRGRGAGRALIEAARDWARNRGYAELASDTQPQNEASIRAHAACGFEEVDRLVKFRSRL